VIRAETIVDVGGEIVYRLLTVLGWVYLLIGVLFAWNNPDLVTWSNVGRFIGAGFLFWVIVGGVIDGVLRLVIWILSPLFEK